MRFLLALIVTLIVSSMSASARASEVRAASSADPNAVWNQPATWQATVSASTSGQINGISFHKPQMNFNLSGRRNSAYLSANVQTVESNIGTDLQEQLMVGYSRDIAPVTLRWQMAYKAYPGTPARYNDHAISYQMSASRNLIGVNTSLGVEYTDADYTSIRKSYGINLSLGRGLFRNIYGWLAISHKRNWGSVNFTNTNMGIAWQVTQHFGLSASLNNWHAYANWAHDRPTLSIAVSRKL